MLTQEQKEKLNSLGFIKSQLVKGHMHYGKQMSACLLVVTDTLDWYISLPYPVVDKSSLDLLKSYEVYLIAVTEELSHYGRKDTGKESSR